MSVLMPLNFLGKITSREFMNNLLFFHLFNDMHTKTTQPHTDKYVKMKS